MNDVETFFPAFDETLRLIQNTNDSIRHLEQERVKLIDKLKEDFRKLPPGWQREFNERVDVILGEDGAEAFWMSVQARKKT